MKNFIIVLMLLLSACTQSTEEVSKSSKTSLQEWSAQWITTKDKLPEKNAWLAFRKDFEISDLASPMLKIAVDSKYWLWVNGEMVIREGGLKRGPTPTGTYYDEVDLTGKLKEGDNSMAVLVWYFGKDGFTHKSSGKAGLLAEIINGDQLVLGTDSTWKAKAHTAFIAESAPPQPNYRLPESNIVFDARKELEGWTKEKYESTDWSEAQVIGKAEAEPWGELVKRSIPFWKDFGLKAYENTMTFPVQAKGDTLKMVLPYNAQVTPYLKVNAPEGKRIVMLTDHYKGGSEYNMRAEYITKEGVQEYESPGWINGHTMYYVIPEGVEVLDLKYRETGYDTEFVGSFECNDPFLNELWEKSLRTLYVTMRDNYMDCPDRERAQWWGDEVLESGEAFYALDRKSDLLVRKGILELMNWQREDGTIFSPLPAGNWSSELPGQMLASVGYFGFWNYYWHTGDKETIATVYEPVKRYLGVWNTNENGVVDVRQGGWLWGDWGQNRDIPIILNTQYYLALEGFKNMAQVLNKTSDVDSISQLMATYKPAFNRAFWKGDHYRSDDYKGETDDRSQGLAVVAGLVDEDKYEAIYKVLQDEQHGSPYMEKYVLEALFQMGYPEFALQRMKERFDKMVNHPTITTLWEGWGIGAEGYGGGTTNHAWSGGGLTLLSQYVAGVYPTSAGYETFHVRPQLGGLKEVKCIVPSIKGDIKVSINKSEEYTLEVSIPENTEATFFLPEGYTNWKLGDQEVDLQEVENTITLQPGSYKLVGV
ncbi:MAG: alpha-L-rhamnosidase C-terminal domain-containing protein [Bacteroidota bacterium]